MNNTQTIDRYKHAWHGVSFRPEKRFESFKQYHLEIIQNVKDYCDQNSYDPEWMIAKIEDCATTYLNAQSSCMSSMITGPANFPVARNQKRMNWADNHHSKYLYYCQNYKKILDKKHRPKETETDKVEKWRQKVDYLKKWQDAAKRVNALIRKHKLTNLVEARKIDELQNIFSEYPGIEKDLQMSLKINYPFKMHGFTLSNNLANIKRLEGQIKVSERTKERNDNASLDNDLCRVEHDNEELRWNLFFDGKPSETIRTTLKSNGFKWSPKRGAWTRFSKSMSQDRLSSILESLKGDE